MRSGKQGGEKITAPLQRALVIGHWLRTAQADLTPQQAEEIVEAVLREAFVLLAADDDGRLQPILPPDAPASSLSPEAQQHIRDEWHRRSAAERAAHTAERRAFLNQMREKYART
jgi:uncharacterized protein (DUF2267 family)